MGDVVVICPDCYHPYEHPSDVMDDGTPIPGITRACTPCDRDPKMRICPVWADGKHCFETCDRQVDPENPMVIRARAKACACGVTVERKP